MISSTCQLHAFENPPFSRGFSVPYKSLSYSERQLLSVPYPLHPNTLPGVNCGTTVKAAPALINCFVLAIAGCAVPMARNTKTHVHKLLEMADLMCCSGCGRKHRPVHGTKTRVQWLLQMATSMCCSGCDHNHHAVYGISTSVWFLLREDRKWKCSSVLIYVRLYRIPG